MQELQILPYDQCFAAFGGFPDSDTKQNSGSTVRKYSITNAYSVSSPCSTSTDIDCRSSWRFFLVWISLIRAGEVKRETDGGGGQGKREKILTAFSPYPLTIVFFQVRSWFSFRAAVSQSLHEPQKKTQKRNCQLRSLPLIWLSTVKVKEPILLIHPVRGGRGGSCHIKVTAYWPSRLGVEIAQFDLT